MKDWQIVVKGKGAISSNKPTLVDFEGASVPVGKIDAQFIQQLREKYKNLSKAHRQDSVVLYAIEAANKAIQEAGWHNENNIAVNVGSSRGATELLEKSILKYYQTKECDAYTSPLTTLGNISTAISNQFGLNGYSFSHSITCSTSASAFVNAYAWLNAKITDKMIVGGAEAPITDFTIAQMKNIGIYAQSTDDEFPSKPLGFLNGERKNSMILGEGAGVIGLERVTTDSVIAGDIVIAGIGFTQLPPPSYTGIESNGTVFYDCMKQAIEQDEEIDAVFLHAPGTITGDKSEYTAITNLFGEKTIPLLYSNKWKIGHCLGASFALSLCEAIDILKSEQEQPALPYLPQQKPTKAIHSILVNSSGFGGNAVSVLIKKIEQTKK
ncbi:beta-ketoacyl synthase [Flavobacteriales bacterium]|nr:beta-ketoacyl synthase [Flavobacteriales bacterium]